jgi:iron complex transport system substrate-binding protein
MIRTRTALAVVFTVALVATPLAGVAGATTATEAASSSAPPSDVTNTTAIAEPCEYPLELRDATGEAVTVDGEPERIVTLGAASAQTMWELDARDKVVGVTQFAAYLDGASAKANVSGEGRTRVSNEKVIAQSPDLVLAENISNPETVSALREAGLTVYYFNNSENIDDVYRKVATTGRLAGECDAAIDTVRWMKEEMTIVRNTTDGQEPRDFLYALYGYTAGENTFINSGLEAAGGNNLAIGVVEFPPSGYAPINPETVANLSVEWIVYPGTSAAIPRNAAWNSTTAVQNGNTVAVDENRISQPAPRVVLAVGDIAKTWYPDAYASANESLRGSVQVNADIYERADTTTTTDGTTATDDDATTAADTTATATTADGGAPGFGPVVALLAAAVLVAGSLARSD